MTASPLRAMAARLDDKALAALASRGLVRRAAADAAGATTRLVAESDNAAELEVDGETVRLSAHGIERASCTCPAHGLCRHRLAALIFLRAGAPDTAAAAPSLDDWKTAIAAIDAEQLARFTGKTGRRALQGREADGVASLNHEGMTLAVAIGDAEAVVFPWGGGLEAAIAKGPTRQRKQRIAAAVLAARRAFGLPAWPNEPESEVALAPQDGKVLQEIRAFCARAYGTALALAPAAMEDEARRLSLAGRIEAAPRLAGALRRIAAGIAAIRQRSVDADPDALLAMLAETDARCVALDAAATPALRRALAGEVRQDYDKAGDLQLFGLGARLWETPSGARGVTTHFFEPARGRCFAVTLARPDRVDGQFVPRSAFRDTPVWGASMAELSQGRVELAGGRASETGRLSATTPAKARAVAPWTPTRAEVGAWACCFDNWTLLEEHLRDSFAPRLAAPAAAEMPVVLLCARHAEAQFDPLTQTLTWPLADAERRWIGLTLQYQGNGQQRIAALERRIQREPIWAVLALARQDANRIELRPYALWGASPTSLDFDATPAEASGAPALLQRLRAHKRTPSKGPAGFVPTLSPTATLLDQAWSALLARAETGALAARSEFEREAASLALRLESGGLQPLAGAFRRIADGPAEGLGIHCLRAAYAIDAARKARARLGWML